MHGAAHRPMIDREKVLTVLRRRFPGAPAADLAAAANAIVGLPDEWDDVTESEPALLARIYGADLVGTPPSADGEFRLFRRRLG